jgi:hypothetical protein
MLTRKKKVAVCTAKKISLTFDGRPERGWMWVVYPLSTTPRFIYED